MFLSTYHYIPFHYSLALYHQDHLFTCVLFISVMESVKGAQFLNIASLLFLLAALAGSSATPPARVISTLTSIYASL